MSDAEKSELCSVCKLAEMTGAVFVVRLRTQTDRERVGGDTVCCDGCANLIINLLRQPDLLKRLKELTQ